MSDDCHEAARLRILGLTSLAKGYEKRCRQAAARQVKTTPVDQPKPVQPAVREEATPTAEAPAAPAAPAAAGVARDSGTAKLEAEMAQMQKAMALQMKQVQQLRHSRTSVGQDDAAVRPVVEGD